MQESQFDQLLKDVERIKKCSQIAKQEINKSLDSVIELLTQTKQQINEPIENGDQDERKIKIKNSLHNLHEKLKEKKPLKQVIDSHKKQFQYLSKYGKNLDKLFRSDINSVFKDTDAAFDREMLNEAIAEHLLIEKKIDLYESFMEDTGLTHKVDQEKLESLKLIQDIFDQFQNHHLNEAILWAESKKEELTKIDSPLLFLLHRLQVIIYNQLINIFNQVNNNKLIKCFRKFIQQLQKGQNEGITYARENLRQFLKGTKKYADQAQQLMMYMLKKDERVICEQNNLYTQLEELLLDNFCKLYNLTVKSALLQCLIAGTLALPKFIKYTQISSLDEEFREYHTKNEYPIEVEIGKEFKYHSIFVCPISRDVVEPDQNPVLLTCGHVISEASMKRITSNTNKEKFKCPTCPKEMTAKDTKKIFF